MYLHISYTLVRCPRHSHDLHTTQQFSVHTSHLSTHSQVSHFINCSLASLGLVSAGAATDGCHPNFSSKKLMTFFSRHIWRLMTVLVLLSRVTPD